MKEVDALVKKFEDTVHEDIHLRFISELNEDTKEFELDDTTLEDEKSQDKEDKVDLENNAKQNKKCDDDDFMEELETTQYDMVI